MRRRLTWLLTLLIALPNVLNAASPGVYAIVGGTVHRVSSPSIDRGVVIIRNGLIDAVGANLPIPEEAAVIDASGMHVYPGLIDAQTRLGMPVAKTGAAASEGPKINASTRAVNLVNLTAKNRSEKRSTGVTTVLIAATGELFNGSSAVVNLGDRELRDSVVKSPAALQVGFATKSWGTFPDSTMGAIYGIRQAMLDARHQAEARSVYERNPSGKSRPSIDENLEAIEPAVQRRLPVVFEADNAEAVMRALRLTREFNLRAIVSGARSSYEIADDIKKSGADVFVSMNFPKAPATEAEEEPLRLIRRRVNAPTSPAELQKRGVRYALVSAGGAPGDFLAGIRKAIGAGLTAEQALRAVTLNPAQILGVDRQLGSIDRGKIANIVITDKPIFEKERRITNLLIDGRLVALAEEEAGESEASPIAGTWSVEVKMSDRSIALQVTFRGAGENLEGTFSGDRGSGDLNSVSFADGTVRFAFIAKTAESGESSEWKFEGTVEGDTIRGTVGTSLGSFPFTGSRQK